MTNPPARTPPAPFRPIAARVACCVLAAAATLVLLGGASDAEDSGGDARPSGRAESWYTESIAKDELGGSIAVHFWSKGPLLRSEAVVAGRPIVTIVDATTYYIFERVSAQGVAIERSARAIEQDATRGRPFGNELDDVMRSGGELIETQETNVGPVDVFRATNSAGRRTVLMSTKAPRVPLRVETFDRATSTTGRIEYRNWIYGPEIPDSFFAPDARVKLEQVSYDQYKKRVGRETIGPAPVLYSDLLHGHD